MLMEPTLLRVQLDLRQLKKPGDQYTGTSTICFSPSFEESEPYLCREATGWECRPDCFMFFVDKQFVTLQGISVVQGKKSFKPSSVEPVGSADGSSCLYAVRLATPVGCDYGTNCELQIKFTAKSAGPGSFLGVYAIPPHNIITSFFEVTHQRKAFPGIDAPSLRVPFELQLQVRKEFETVLGNTEVTESKESGDGSKIVKFGATQMALPAYVHAFFCAACPMQRMCGVFSNPADGSEMQVAVHATKASKFPVQLAYNTAMTGLELLSQFFDLPLPQTKMDIVIVPGMSIAGMEHDGLISINEETGVKKAGGLVKNLDEQVIQLIVHEITHHWIGNWVGVPFAMKEGVCQIVEQCIGDLVMNKPMRKYKVQAQQQQQSSSADAAGVGEMDVAAGAELTGLTYQHAFNKMQAYVATVGWEAFRDSLRSLVQERQGTYVTQSDFDSYFST